MSREIVPVDGTTARGDDRVAADLAASQRRRGEPGADIDGLVEVIERLSFFASRNPDVAELDINPLMASAAGCRAVDARIIWG